MILCYVFTLPVYMSIRQYVFENLFLLYDIIFVIYSFIFTSFISSVRILLWSDECVRSVDCKTSFKKSDILLFLIYVWRYKFDILYMVLLWQVSDPVWMCLVRMFICKVSCKCFSHFFRQTLIYLYLKYSTPCQL